MTVHSCYCTGHVVLGKVSMSSIMCRFTLFILQALSQSVQLPDPCLKTLMYESAIFVACTGTTLPVPVSGTQAGRQHHTGPGFAGGAAINQPPAARSLSQV